MIALEIAGVGYNLPKNIVTNGDLTKLYDTSDEWIYSRTGIKERRVVSGEETARDLGYKAALMALKNAKTEVNELDMIIVAASTPADLYPAMACRIQAKLGVKKDIPAFDVTAACSGLIYGLEIARAFIGAGLYKNILLVMTDNNSRFCDWNDRATSVLFGDGAGAVVVKASKKESDILSLNIRARGSIGEHITLPLTGQNCPLVEPCEVKPIHIKMNGREVYKFAVSMVPEYIEKCLQEANLTPDDIDYLIPHQANQRIIDAIALRLKYDKNKVISNIEKYGNTSAASVPIAITEGIESGKIKLPSTAILCGFGAGMTWGVAIVRLQKGIC